MGALNDLVRNFLVRGASRGSAGRVVVLCYHSVHPTWPYRTVTPDMFDEHLGCLRDFCDLLPLSEVVASVGKVAKSPRPRVAITFDDGYEDNWRFALPILIKYSVKATFYITSGFVDREADVLRWFRTLRPEGGDFQPMSWEQVTELKACGMEVGAHTVTHPRLTALRREDLERELTMSKHVVEEKLQTQVASFAYPFGKPKRHFNRAVMRAVRDAGYTNAVAAFARGVLPTDSPLAIPRFFVSADSPSVLESKVMGGWDRLGRLQEVVPGWMARIVSGTDY
jgi:peptidoglycan/xylan/chitin deacetylase (PgdA/CDA1 family)